MNSAPDVAYLLDDVGCRKVVMVLGPHDPLCLYSVFLAKLVNMQRRLTTAGGGMAIAGLSDNGMRIFQVAGLHKFFHFYPDIGPAVESLKYAVGQAFEPTVRLESLTYVRKPGDKTPRTAPRRQGAPNETQMG